MEWLHHALRLARLPRRVRRTVRRVVDEKLMPVSGTIGRDVTPLRMRLRDLASARPRFGYRRLHILLGRGGWRTITKRRVGCTARNSLGCGCTADGTGPASSGAPGCADPTE